MSRVYPLSGAVLGLVFWAVVTSAAYAEIWGYMHPPPLLTVSLWIAAFPIRMGGGLYLWADTGPPFEWMDGRAVNHVFALFLYPVLGSLLGVIVGLLMARRLSRE